MAIHILPPQLANQIAAGEVVERPASVVKELVENSLDAGASKIEIDISQGGMKRILIRDNGCGIPQADLALALARHATSKILTLDDLEAIISLGFRGEALASISSVSRLILTSCTADQQEGWQAYAEGRDMQVTVKPAAHPCGTTIEALDLFYNTPARRKFLRTEKTEFAHIDEVIRRIALVRFDVDFILTHNGKKIRQYRAAHQDLQREQRLAAICGRSFLSSALKLEWQHEELSLTGWVAAPQIESEGLNLQYCYVNGRMMKDKLINHAIRQAYQEQGAADYLPAYVLYLTIDPRQIDVNVHPAKHEVRFHQSRLVHDFIYQAVRQVLQTTLDAETVIATEQRTSSALVSAPAHNRPAAGANIFTSAKAASPVQAISQRQEQPQLAKENRNPATNYRITSNPYRMHEGKIYQQLVSKTSAEGAPPCASVSLSTAEQYGEANYRFGKVLTIVQQLFALVECRTGLKLLALSQAEILLQTYQLTPTDSALKSQPLLIPMRIKATTPDQQVIRQYSALLLEMGLDIHLEGEQLILRAVPVPLRQRNLPKLIPEMLTIMADSDAVTTKWLADWLANHPDGKQTEWSMAQAITLLSELERVQPNLVKLSPANLLQPINLDSYIKILSHDQPD
jgi:DNA mismatch repair protein MutL